MKPVLARLLAIALLHGCAAPERPSAPIGIRHFQQAFEGGYTVDYQVEMARSKIDPESCFAFFSGTVGNASGRTLSRRSPLRFLVHHDGRLLFRDLTYPRTDVPPGSRVQFELVQSPVHRKECPSYDKIEVFLTPIPLPAAGTP